MSPIPHYKSPQPEPRRTERAAPDMRAASTPEPTAPPASVTYRPGDMVHGHILGSDLAWHPIAKSASSSPSPNPSQATPQQGVAISRAAVRPDTPPPYWKRYRQRWFRTSLTWGLLMVPLTLLNLARLETFRDYEGYALIVGSALDLVIGFMVGFLIYGTLTNFLVAIPRRLRRAR